MISIETSQDGYENVTYKKTNREKRMTQKLGRWWCDSCDMAMVAIGQKCPICKSIQGGRKRPLLKKEPYHGGHQ